MYYPILILKLNLLDIFKYIHKIFGSVSCTMSYNFRIYIAGIYYIRKPGHVTDRLTFCIKTFQRYLYPKTYINSLKILNQMKLII